MKISIMLSSISNFIKGFKTRTLLKKYFKMCFVLLLIPLLIIVSISMYYYFQKSNTAITNELNNRYQLMRDTANSVFDTSNKQIFQLITDNSVNAFIYSDDIETGEILRQPKMLIDRLINLNEHINAIEIYSLNNNYVLSTRIPAFLDELPDTAWYDYYKQTGKESFIIPNKFTKISPAINEICICRGVYRKGKLQAFVLMYINPDNFLNISSSDGTYYILDSDNHIIYSSDAKSIGSDIVTLYPDSFGKLLSQDPPEQLNEKDKWSYGSQTYVRCGKFFGNLLTFTLKTHVKRDINYMHIIFISIGGIFILLLFTLLLAFFISQNFYDAIEKMLSYFSISKETKIEDDFIENVNELHYIQENIQSSLKSRDDMENNLVLKSLQLKSAQSVALQSQFSSHFLFNTLNYINMKAIALTRSENDVSTAISLLSDMLYTVLHSSEDLITIREEFDFIKKFIQIETLKHNCNYNIVWDIDEPVLDLCTLKLILQPIIENAFTHAIFKLPPDVQGQLQISAKRSENNQNIIFTISDNGITTEETINKIKQILDDPTIKLNTAHIGISNVNSRIKLVFGESYGCSVKRDNGHTIFKICLPVISVTNTKSLIQGE